MSKPANRTQLMARLGAVQANHVWAWCGVNELERKVYFSIWADHGLMHSGEKAYLLQAPDWGLDDSKAARADHDAKFALVFDQGYDALGYFIWAKDPRAYPREIQRTQTGSVLKLKVTKLDDGRIIGTPFERVEIR